MCDTLVALAGSTARGAALFAKNSDRERNEAQGLELERAARQVGARCLHVDLSVPFDDVVMRIFRLGGFLR